MKLLPRIFGRIAFVRAELAPDGSCRTEVFLGRCGVLAPADRAAAKNNLATVVVCGHGVVTKADDSQITARIKADAQTFVWSTTEGRTSFVRHERLQPLAQELAGEGIVPVQTFCTETGMDFGKAAEAFAGQIYDGLRWHGLVRLTPESSALAQVLVRRAALPLLGIMLCLLAANAVLSPQLDAQRQVLRAEIAERERSASNAATAGARQRELFAEFAMRPRTLRSVVCDRIARAVPERVVLTQLNIEPLVKRFETGKPLLRRKNFALIVGTAPAACDVSAFVQGLSELACCREVRLTSVERERDGERLTFRIETVL